MQTTSSLIFKQSGYKLLNRKDFPETDGTNYKCHPTNNVNIELGRTNSIKSEWNDRME